MGSCCAKTVTASRDAVAKIKARFPKAKHEQSWCESESRSSGWENQYEVATQTEAVVFELMQNLNTRILPMVHGGSRQRTESNMSTWCHASQVTLVGGRDSSLKEAAGSAKSFEEVLSVIERVQDICGRVSVTDQVSLLCSVGYLRDYCVFLNEQHNKNKMRKRSSVEDLGNNSHVKYWMTAYAGDTQNHRGGSKRFKKMAMAVKMAIALSGGRNGSFSFSSSMGLAEVTSETKEQCDQFLSDHLDDWNFDQFRFDRISCNHGLTFLFKRILEENKLFGEFSIDAGEMVKYCLLVEDGYRKHNNTYHNEVHGADVLQTAYYMLKSTKVTKWLSSLELLSLLFAAMIHDVQHTGTNNGFHVQSQSNLALLYNDKSVLENHHVSTAYSLLKEVNPFANMTPAQFKSMRSIVVDCVLATDMAAHFQQVSMLKNTTIDVSLIERQDLMNSILHCADISGPSKTWDIHHEWTLLLMEEFFCQGDQERELGMTVSPLCDRHAINIPNSQIGFISYITVPAFAALGDSIDAVMREKHERKFLEDSTNFGGAALASMAKSRSNFRDMAGGQMPPIEDVYEAMQSTAGVSVFHYRPIKRPWDTHFKENADRWQKMKTEEEEH